MSIMCPKVLIELTIKQGGRGESFWEHSGVISNMRDSGSVGSVLMPRCGIRFISP